VEGTDNVMERTDVKEMEILTYCNKDPAVYAARLVSTRDLV